MVKLGTHEPCQSIRHLSEEKLAAFSGSLLLILNHEKNRGKKPMNANDADIPHPAATKGAIWYMNCSK
jgi:hypothetical protein